MHVRICVECGEEYRPGIVVCADCGGALEDRTDDGSPVARASASPAKAEAAAPEAEAGEDPEAAFTDSVAHTERAVDLRADADRLIAAGIDFRIRPSTPAGYRLVVAAEDREAALEALGSLVESGSSDEAKTCPACGTAVSADAVDCPDCGLQVGFEADELPCPRCGSSMEGSKCPECGA